MSDEIQNYLAWMERTQQLLQAKRVDEARLALDIAREIRIAVSWIRSSSGKQERESKARADEAQRKASAAVRGTPPRRRRSDAFNPDADDGETKAKGSTSNAAVRGTPPRSEIRRRIEALDLDAD